MGLAHTDEERVKFVEQHGIGWQACLEEGARLVVARPSPEQAVAHEHTARVGVRHEDRARSRVQQDRVGRLGPDPRYGEELTAERGQWEAPQRSKGAAEAVEQPPGQGSQAPRLDTRRAGRADGSSNFRLAARGEASRPEEALGAKRGDGTGSVSPDGVLGEHGAHRDLVGGPAGPPALRPEAPLERRVEPQEPRPEPVARRSGGSAPARVGATD